LQILTEGFSKAGIPVFAADVKGDLSGLSQAGSETHKLHDKLIARAEKIDGEQGHPIRTTIAEMGPTLLSRLMGLNETQEGILTIAFELADDEDMLLLDMKDLSAILILWPRTKRMSAVNMAMSPLNPSRPFAEIS